MYTNFLQVEELSFNFNDQKLDIHRRTEHLYIRSYLSEDFDRCVALYGDKEITKYFDHGEPRSPAETLDFINERGRRYFDQGQPFGLFSVFLKENRAFIGQVDLVPTGIPGEVEIGWILRKEFQGHGYCSEAVLNFLLPLIEKIREMGFESNGLVVNRVIATAHPENIASNRMIQKAGLSLYQKQLRYGGKPRNWYCLNLNTGYFE
ncbi:MAG: GNAT family N-acetyltransferase [Parachlamydiales bacterium]|nr:GNAT family N-acetyltransferase [Candidatus Acheromyda pituitae]